MRFEIAVSAHSERTVQHDEQCVRGAPLGNKHFPPHQIQANHCVQSRHPLFRTERSEQSEVLSTLPHANVALGSFIGDIQFDCTLEC